ncbi:MAG: hypothetical protein PHG85_00055 [Candidatus Altiarchaeota archaeon]|nr:hypothetical protein [Candidatus Altiarchaeota archaeon]
MKIKGCNGRRFIALALTLLFVISVLPPTVLALPWTTYVGLLLSAVIGFMGVIFAWIALAIIKVINGFLVSSLFCALLINPTFEAPGFTSVYNGICMLPAAGVRADALTNMIRLFLAIMYPMFLLALVFLGAYLVFMANSPPHRARAKQMLLKLLIGMVLASLSPIVYQVLLIVGGSLTDGVLNVIDVSIIPGAGTIRDRLIFAFTHNIMPFPDLWPPNEDMLRAFDMPKVMMAIIVLALTAVFWILAIMVAMFRYTATTFLGIIFPLTVSLYMFEFTRNAGRKMFKATFIFIFTPFIMAMWLACALALLPYTRSSSNYFSSLFLLILMSMMVSFSPLALSGMLNVIGGIITSAGQFVPGFWGTAMVAAGSLMQGKGASAMSMAAAKFSASKMLKGGKALMGAAVFGGKAGFVEAVKRPFSGIAKTVSRAASMASGMAGGTGRGMMFGMMGSSALTRGAASIGLGKALGDYASAKISGRGRAGAFGSMAYGMGKRGLSSVGKGFMGGGSLMKSAVSPFSPSAVAGRWSLLGRTGRVAGKALLRGQLGRALGIGLKAGFGRKIGGLMAKGLRFAAKVSIGKALGKVMEKATGGLITGRDMFQGLGKSIGDKISSLPAALMAKGRSIGALAGAAYAGGKMAVQSGLQASKAAIGKAWQGAKNLSIKGVGKTLGIGALALAAGAGLSLLMPATAAAATLAAGGLLASKTGRGAALRKVQTTAKAAWDMMKRTAMGRSVSALSRIESRKGLGQAIKTGVQHAARAAVHKALGDQEFGRYTDKLKGKGQFQSGGPVGKNRALIGSLARRAAQKALNLTDSQVAALEKRGGGARSRRESERSRNKINNVIDNKGEGFDKLKDGDKKELAYIAGIDTTQPGWEQQLKRDLGMQTQTGDMLEKSNDHFDKVRDGIDKTYSTGDYGEKFEDKSLANKSLREDAKTDGNKAETDRQLAQYETGGDRNAALEAASAEKEKNPVDWADRNGTIHHGMTEDTAKDLEKAGIQTRGELANMTDDQMDRMVRMSSDPAHGMSQNYTKDELSSMRDGAIEATTRSATQGEQSMMDRGMSADEIRDRRDKDRGLKDAILEGGGHRAPEREDFLTALEEER